MHLFVYGTLAIPEIFHALTGFHAEPRLATLQGYARYTLYYPDIAHAPVILPEADSHIEGVVIGPFDDTLMALIDAYEYVDSGLYQRVSINAKLADGLLLPAQCYIAGSAALAQGEFRPHLFEAVDIDYYLQEVIPEFLQQWQLKLR